MDQTSAIDGYAFFGDSISVDNVMTMAEFTAALGTQSQMAAKVEAPITAACLKKGCWMTMDMEGDQEMLVRFKDYGFFVPIDCAGSTAIIDGIASVETISVADLRHYAEDEGMSKEEAEASITEPETKMTFEATGVAIKAAS